MNHAKLTHLALPFSLAGLLLVAGCNKNQPPQNAEQPAASQPCGHRACAKYGSFGSRYAKRYAGRTGQYAGPTSSAATAGQLYHSGRYPRDCAAGAEHCLEHGA